MKKLFLFAFSAMLICACSESGTDQNSNEDYIRFSQYNLSFLIIRLCTCYIRNY